MQCKSLIANTWLRKADKNKIAYGSGCNDSEIDFCIVGNVDRNFFKHVKLITGDLLHNLVVVDVDKKQTQK